MRTTERRWHLRVWLVLGPLCVTAIALAVWNRPRKPVAGGSGAIGNAAPAEGGEPREGPR